MKTKIFHTELNIPFLYKEFFGAFIIPSNSLKFFVINNFIPIELKKPSYLSNLFSIQISNPIIRSYL